MKDQKEYQELKPLLVSLNELIAKKDRGINFKSLKR